MSYWIESIAKNSGTSREPEGTPREPLSNEQRATIGKRLQRKHQERIKKQKNKIKFKTTATL